MRNLANKQMNKRRWKHDPRRTLWAEVS